MPGEQPLGVPPLPMTGHLQPCSASHDSGCPSRPPSEDSGQACRTAKGTREVGSKAQTTEPPQAPPRQVGKAEPRTLSGNPWRPRKGGSPRGPPGKAHTQTQVRPLGRGHSGPQQLYRLSIASTKDKRGLDKSPGGPPPEALLTPSLLKAEVLPQPDELSFQRCFSETPPSFTSTDYTSPSPTPGPPPLRAPRSPGPSPSRPTPYSEFLVGGADSWPPPAENRFPAASFGVPLTDPEPSPKGSGPSPSPRAASFQSPFLALRGEGSKPFPVDTGRQPRTDDGPVGFAFHPTPGAWPEGSLGTSPTYPLPAQQLPQLLPCYPGPASSLDTPHSFNGALPSPGAAPHTPSPFLASLHKSLTPALPERPPSAHDSAVSPRRAPNPLPPGHFLGKAYNGPRASSVATSPGPLDKELVTPGRTPTPRPQLWEGTGEALPLIEPAAAPFPAAPPVKAVFFKDQRLCLQHSPPLPWSQVLPAAGPGPTPMELLSQLPYPTGAPEWPASSQEPRKGPGTPTSSPPGLFPYSGRQDTSAQPLFFGVTPPQASPHGTPGLPPPRGVGASPSESPLPSPATTVAGSSSCSSLSPLSGSPANPSSEESQLPGPPGRSTFFHHPTHPQETSSPFPLPEPLPTHPVHYQSEPPKAFPFPTEALGPDAAFECLQEAPFAGPGPGTGSTALGAFPREPPPYSAHHFPLSSASLDQLDVLLTCRQCDQNYSNLVSFLQHRQFCSLLPRAPEGPPQPSVPTPPGPAPLRALADVPPPSLLGHAKMAGFLLDGDASHSLAAPLPLPASDLDLDDVAKLDSLITEALNGLEDPSDTPEIDSSFIDVFVDEDPVGPRVPAAGQPPKTRPGATPDLRAQPLLPATASTPEPGGPCPGTRGCSGPETASQSLAPPEADGSGLAGPPRRGSKQLQLFREGLGTPQGPGGGSRTICLRPRKKDGGAEAPRPPARDLRPQAPSPGPLPVQTRSSGRLQPARSKHSRRRAAQGGQWSKELLHKVLQQNGLNRRRAGRGRGGHGSPGAARPPPSPAGSSLRQFDYTSESEEDDGPGVPRPAAGARGRPQGWHRGEKRKDAGGTPSPKDEQDQQTPKRLVRQRARVDRNPQAPGSLGAATPSPLQSPGLRESHGEKEPKGPSRETPEENPPPLGCSQETKHTELAGENPPGTSQLLREVCSLSPGNSVVRGSSPTAPQQPQPGPEDTGLPQLPGNLTRLGPRGRIPPAGADSQPPRCLPELPVPTTSATDNAHSTPSTQPLKSHGLDWGLPHEGVPVATKGPPPDRSSPSDLLLGPKELTSPCGKPLAPDGPVGSTYLRQDSLGADPLVPKSPRNTPYPTETDPRDVQSPLTLESTSLFSRLPVDGFDPPLYDSLLANKQEHPLLTCADQPPQRPLLDTPHPACVPEKDWPLPEEVAPGLPSPVGCFPDLPGESCPGEGQVAPRTPPAQGKSQEGMTTSVSTLSEEELEIKWLVTELESQLQTSTVKHQAPVLLDMEPTGGNPGRAAHQPPMPPTGPATMAQQDTFLADGLAGPGKSSPGQDGLEAAMAPVERALGSPQGCWPCPAPGPPGVVALHPGGQEDTGSVAAVGPARASCAAQSRPQDQRMEPTQAEKDSGIQLGGKVPGPPQTVWSSRDARSITERSPDQEPWSPGSSRTTRTHPSGGALLPQPPKWGGDLSPEPPEAGEPCQDALKSGTCRSPVAHSAPAVTGQGAGGVTLGAMALSGTGHRSGPQERPAGNKECEPTEVHSGPGPRSTPVSDAGSGSGSQASAASPLCQLQRLAARAAKSKDGAQCDQHREPSGPKGDCVGSESVALSQAQSSERTVQGTAGPAVARRPPGPEADGHLGSLGQAKFHVPEPKGQGQASQLQPEGQSPPEKLSEFTMAKAKPGATLTRHVEGVGRLRQLEGGGAAWHPPWKAGEPLSPIASDREASVLAPTATHAQSRREGCPVVRVDGSGHGEQLLFAGGSPVCPVGDPTHCNPTPASAAALGPCGPERLTQEEPLSVPPSATEARGESGGLHPAPPSCEDPPYPQSVPAQAPTDARAEQYLATTPPGRTGLWAPEGGLADSSPLMDALEGAHRGSDFTPAHGGHSPDSSTPRALEDSGEEQPAGGPAPEAPSPPAGTISPGGTNRAPGHPSLPPPCVLEAARGLWTLDRRVTSPEPHCPSSGPEEGQCVMAKPTDACPVEATGQDSHTCLESGVEADGEGCWEDPRIPGTGHCGSPWNHRHNPRQAPGGDLLCPQEPKQKPRSLEHGQRTARSSPGAPPVTCEICHASFRSRPGLSRHKARKHRSGRSPACGAVLPSRGTPEPTASTPQTSGVKGPKAASKEKPGSRLQGPSLTVRPPPGPGSAEDRPGREMPTEAGQGLRAVEAPGPSPHPEPQTPGPFSQGTDMAPRAHRPRKTSKLQKGAPHPKLTAPRGAQRQGRELGGFPRDSGMKSSPRGRKVSVGRFQKKSEASDAEESRPPVTPDHLPDRAALNPSSAVASYPARPSCCLSLEGEWETDGGQPPRTTSPEPGVMGDTDGVGPGAAADEATRARSPWGDLMTAPRQAGQDAASGLWGPREPRTGGTKPAQASRGGAAGDSSGAKSSTGEGVMGAHEPPSVETSSPPGCDPQGFLGHPEAGDHDTELQAQVSGACSPGLRGPLGPFSDTASFSQLFPLGNPLTRKKNPRVYGQRRKNPKLPLPPEPCSEVEGPTTPCSTRLPTDPSDYGSPCLSHEEPWADEAFLVNGFFSSKVPGIKPWAPSSSLWALGQPEKGSTPAKEAPSGPRPDDLSEGLPELHRVPAAWRGLHLRASPSETSTSLGEMSPEPPSLEREDADSGPPGSAGLPPFPALDFGVLSTRFEVQDLSLLGPCEDPGGLPGTSLLDLQAEVSTQGPQGPRPEAAGGSPGQDHQARAKKGPYKCRVCFRRFRGLGELGLHKLAHSPAPPPTCYMCVERRFGSRQLLRDHLQEKHVQSKAGLWACGMCLRQVPDVWMYNEHLREHAVRFARRGQARTSLGDLSRCLEEGSTIPRFLGSVVGQASQPHGGQRANSKASADRTEARRGMTAKSRAPRASPSDKDGTLVPSSGLVGTKDLGEDSPPSLVPSSCTKAPPSLSPKPWSLSEPLLRAVPVHADCKDPSRHCHHCGKQFPKPFKLQRHLAVHSAQRVFLCPQCPRVYAEHRELRAHRGREHGARGEPERPPTPLYACELCATVMRVIKRSFVCSACNYTFAKKDQFDRHVDKHRRPGRQPFAFRPVRRPGAPGQKTPGLEGSTPSKRRRVAVPGSALGPGVDSPHSPGSSPTPGAVSLPALLPPCPEPASTSAQEKPQTQEGPLEPEGRPVGVGDPPPDRQELLPPFLSPFPAPPAGSKGGEEDGTRPGSPLPLCPTAVPPGLPLGPLGAGSQVAEENLAPPASSRKRRTPAAPRKCALDPSLAQRERQVPRSHMLPKGGSGGASPKGDASKAGGTRGSLEARPAMSAPSKVPVFPTLPRRAVLSPASAEPPQEAEDRPGPTSPKAKPDPSSQGAGDAQHSAAAGGGSQPQPASGLLQSETATTPAKTPCLGQSPPPARPPPQATARGHSQGPRGAREQGSRESVGGCGGKRRGRAPGPTGGESTGVPGRSSAAPDKSPRNPRKQAVPRHVPPTKPRANSQTPQPPLQPLERQREPPGQGLGGFRHRREGLGMAVPKRRLPHGPPRRGSAVSPCPCPLRTAESQSHLLSQLFGQRVTSFKIPLKRDPTE
ncbi:zinc finger protein 469 [Orycteropus afer afer]|uniref:Zinc finger protein 469 n=1 Tax=Orycteropus afer afer TaxID=1230840 RepID=A0AC54Z5Y7_ORYAF|nr:zinc finger protein 469 [Orycteropus afer afer]